MKKLIILLSSLLLITPGSAKNKISLHTSVELVLNAFSNYESEKDFHWRDLSPALHEISINGHLLSEEIRNQLESIGFNFSGSIVNRTLDMRAEAGELDKTYDIGIFRFHYTTEGNHGVDSTDNNSNSLPDYIDIISEIFVHVYDVQINEMGYTRPPGDGWLPSNYDDGGSNHYDIYVRRLSSSYYGYVQSEYTAQNTGNNEFSQNVNEQNAFTSYMAMRNNYDGFPNSEIENIQVTAAHEFFHAIQYGYDGYEKPWLLESTAVWMEEEIYDDINDCYQYMYSWFNQPEKSLDHVGGSHWYGSWIFFEYIDEHFGGSETIKNIFDEGVNTNSQPPNDYSIQAIDDALSTIGSTFQEALNGMAIANIVMSSNPGNAAEIYSYEEAEDFPVDGPDIFSIVNFSEEDEFKYIQSTSLNQYASQYIKINTGIPVTVTLDTLNGSHENFGLHGVVRYAENNFEIMSDDPLFIYNSLYNVEDIYIVIVSEDEHSSNFDYTLMIEAANTAPKVFSIISPELNAKLDTVFPRFEWFSSKDSNPMDSMLFYIMELGSNPEYMEIVYDGADTSFIPEEALFENVIYHWQVYAYDLADNRTYNKNGSHRFLIQTSVPENNLTFSYAYPNPFPSVNPSIKLIRFAFFIKEYEETLKISVFDLLGREVTELFNGILGPGFYDHLSWNGYNKRGNLVSSGIYYFTIETENGVTNQKITLIH